jgi:hypothetical protein
MSKKKVKAEPKKAVTEELQGDLEANEGAVFAADPSGENMFDEYQEFKDAQGSPENIDPGNIDDIPGKREKEDVTAEAEPDTQAAETSTEKEDADASADIEAAGSQTEKEPSSDEIKMVPHAALHEERKLRQKAEAELRKLRATPKLPESTKPKVDADDYEYEDEGLKRVNARLAAIEEQNRKAQQDRETRTQQDNQRAYQQNLSATDDELKRAGYPGFKTCLARVYEKLQAKVAEDEGNKHLDNPKGWKKIYKEEVWPEFKQLLDEQRLMEKTRDKEDANLISSPGLKTKSHKQPQPLSRKEALREYDKERTEAQLF